MSFPQGPRIATLDGWRGVAILLVVVDHAARHSRFKDAAWAGLGSFGVDIFFVLSGYIITSSLIAEERQTSSISLRNFYLRRAFRILPLVVTYLAVLTILSFLIGLPDVRLSHILGSLFFLRNYQIVAHPGGIYTAHFWSLAIEEHFYLLWPSLLVLAGTSRALWIALAGAFASGLWRIYDCLHPVRWLPGSLPALRLLRTDARLDGLLLGCVLALLLSRERVREFIFRNFPKESPLLLAFLIFFNLKRTNGWPSISTYTLVCLMIASTLIVQEGLAHKWLNGRLIGWIGLISYSVYIWQQLFLLHPDGGSVLGILSQFPINIICTFLVASLSFYAIERPLIAHGRRLQKRKTETLVAS